jgi:outer membrane protein insertion porin family
VRYLLFFLSVCGLAGPAWGDVAEPLVPADDPAFGPRVVIERIAVQGNSATEAKVVLRALSLVEGDTLRTGDPRFRESRFRVLALGHFTDVQLRLERGSRRGAVVVVVTVVERGTFTLNRLYFGTSEVVPLWGGFDVGDTNFLGSGIGVGLGAVWTRAPELPGANPQVALRVRVANRRTFGLPVAVHGTILYNDGSEPMGETIRAYTRAGGTGGLSWDFSPLSSLSLDGRVEHVREPADGLTDVPSRERWLGTAALGLERDTRPDPVLPYTGYRIAAVLEAGDFGGEGFVRAQALVEQWFPVGNRHVLSFHLGGGLLSGGAPWFDRFYLGDVDPLLPPRALDLVVSTATAPDFFDAGMDEFTAGETLGVFTIGYSYRLFRQGGRVHGGDLFASVGIVALKPDGFVGPTPVDLTFNAGLRIDTALGVFELSLGNALGRIPF